VRDITDDFMGLYKNMGGFDMLRKIIQHLGSGRVKIDTEEHFNTVRKNIESHKLDALVIIGGDGSNTFTCLLAENFAKHKSCCSIIGVPKTIDGDLKNENIEVSFGFDTAISVYSEEIGNLCIDALSFKKTYYFIRLMGRSASNIALEC